jgi:hypothetical protein
MGLVSGRNTPDIKLFKSIGQAPFSNIFSFNATAYTSINDYVLCSTLTNLQTLPHSQLTTPSTVYVASTSANDNVSGTGMRVAVLSGLDEFYNITQDIVNLNGQTPVETNVTFSRVFEIIGIAFGSNVSSVTGKSLSVGDIYVGTGTFTAGVPANPIVGIDVSEEEVGSRIGIFTVPNGYLALFRSITCTNIPTPTSSESVNFRFDTHLFGTPSELWYPSIPWHFDGSFQYQPEFLFFIPPRSDLQLLVSVEGNQAQYLAIETTMELFELR